MLLKEVLTSIPLLRFPLHSSTICFLHELAADLAAADLGALQASFQGLLLRRRAKLQLGVHGGQPEAVLVGEEVAGAPGPVALNEWRGAEILQAGARRHQRLTAALGAGRCVLRCKQKGNS